MRPHALLSIGALWRCAVAVRHLIASLSAHSQGLISRRRNGMVCPALCAALLDLRLVALLPLLLQALQLLLLLELVQLRVQVPHGVPLMQRDQWCPVPVRKFLARPRQWWRVRRSADQEEMWAAVRSD